VIVLRSDQTGAGLAATMCRATGYRLIRGTQPDNRLRAALLAFEPRREGKVLPRPGLLSTVSFPPISATGRPAELDYTAKAVRSSYMEPGG
jgi:hypothetical protein